MHKQETNGRAMYYPHNCQEFIGVKKSRRDPRSFSHLLRAALRGEEKIHSI